MTLQSLLPEIIIFDLDNTLAKSKQEITLQMTKLLSRLLSKTKIAIISGASFKQMSLQILSRFPSNANFNNLILLPLNSGEVWEFQKKWKRIRVGKLSSKDRTIIMRELKFAVSSFNFLPKKSFGKIYEDRGGQITYAGLGVNAPLPLKLKWDPDHKKRKKIIGYIKKKLPDFSIAIAGTTSIDITKKGVGKAEGVRFLLGYFSIPKKKSLFFGDAIFPEGNDYSVISTGIPFIRVKNPLDTRDKISKYLI